MNAKRLVKISNYIGFISILLLVYWIFTFILIEVFGLKVFRKNMTESFYLSILGILAMMVGALIINIMFNLTRIAEKHNTDSEASKSNQKTIFGLVFVFPLIAVILFGGDYLTKKKKEKLLSSSAEFIVNFDPIKTNQLLNYSFTKDYIISSADILNLFSNTDRNFPNVQIIVQDSINNKEVYLSFDNYSNLRKKDTIIPRKIEYIYKTTEPERTYLEQVFKQKSNDIRFSSYDGNYELFYPYRKDNKIFVIYFSETQRYGKIGS
jgi:NADH:ubiquinone oxidoreductase subunit 5 (subunit L)/multisubunit Na+/H+ antiporter MnhA subunit